MMPDLTPFFHAYETLASEADAVFARVQQACPDCVTCKTGCSDCCHALFDLSLVEALYLNHMFLDTFPYGPARSDVLFKAAATDRQTTRLKKHFFQSLRDQGDVDTVMTEAAKARIRCPLLGVDDTCALYQYRPITCRLYGVPTAIGGKAHVCGVSHFAKGQGYPTVHLEKIQSRLDALSLELKETIHSRFTELHTVYVPVSMALLTKYDEPYLGIDPAPQQ